VISKLKKRRGSRVAIIAPHGGTIEPVTKKLAEATALHSIGIVLKVSRAIVRTSISLHHFDEPQCLELIAPCDIVVAIRGRKDEEDPATVFVGGLNEVRRDIICL
jgi:phage replication-related protein YjqB (UPF0714/DUF867 family)